MEFIQYLSQENVFTFMFLFGRMSGLIIFFPVFNHIKIPIPIKTAFILILTFLFFPLAKMSPIEPNVLSFLLHFLSEIFLGLIAGLILQLVFAALQLAGEQISFIMGFTMASVIDPQTGSNSPLISQIFTIIALVLFLAVDGHHLLLMFYYKSLGSIELGGFMAQYSMWEYISIGVKNIFFIGYSLAFPIIALSLLSDVIFGMLMKTMPQFNLLVVGFPIKIMLAFCVISVVLGSILFVFKTNILRTINDISSLFF